MMSNAPQFHPIQDLKHMVHEFDPAGKMKNVMAEAKQTIVGAEETAIATASQMYETVVTPGSSIDKQLTAMSHATRAQLMDAWNSVVHMKESMKERLEQARLFSKQRQRLTQQLKGYRIMLTRMREMSSAVPAQQMSMLMRRITECNQSLEHLEQRAQAAFEQATGFARKNLPFMQHREPRRFAKYSSDPLLGIVTYPLWFCLTLNFLTEAPLRFMMRRRGLERRSIGPVRYYFHPGRQASSENEESMSDHGTQPSFDGEADIPIIFVHGIGVGLIAYMPLVDALLATGRPLFFPEIPYVSAFRPLQSPNAVLSPAAVVSTMTAMLATHGYMSGTWMGHSYGTSWLSYMIKYASHAVSAVAFLDPICFCLHQPRLTKAFVYISPDVGQLAYFVRTDAIVNWTVQRSFPWAWICLFLDQIDVPCSIFLSEKDALVPALHVETYLRRNSVSVIDFDQVSERYFENESQFNCVIFRGAGHGDWTESPSETVPTIVTAVEVLCRRAQVLQDEKRES
jgi:pimeloyl-ACP methyl ester carboxylesterase